MITTSPTETDKLLSYLLPVVTRLGTPISDLTEGDASASGIRAIILAATREHARRIHNEFLKLVQGQKWKTVLLGKSNAHILEDVDLRDKTGILFPDRFKRSITSMLTEGRCCF